MGKYEAKTEKRQKKKKGQSVQDMMGIRTFTKYGLRTEKGDLLFYMVSPTNISVLSYANIEIKIRHLMMVLSSLPDIEITCTDSSECFDDNKAYVMIFGHTPTHYFRSISPLEIWTNGEAIGIDCGCGFLDGRLACIRLEDMKVFYSVD